MDCDLERSFVRWNVRLLLYFAHYIIEKLCSKIEIC